MTTAHIYKTRAGWQLLATDGADIGDAIIIGTYESKAKAKRVAMQMGLKAHNY